ncbi:hypothetical protein BH09PLA1_BH09PLA1_16870 [soil metagenome]
MNRDAARRGFRLFSIFAILIALAASSLNAARTQEFTFDASNSSEKPKTVNLAGSFNGWSKDATPMKQVRPDVWSTTVELEEGLHHYKFVLNGDKWISDPLADKSLEEDAPGGPNSGIVVGPNATKLPPPQPNQVNTDAVVFNPKDPADVNVFAPEHVRFRVRTQAADVDRIVAHVLVDGATETLPFPLDRVSTGQGFDTFAGVVNTQSSNVKFYLTAFDGSASATIDQKGNVDQRPIDAWPVSTKPGFATPEWAKHAVWYQIFPERFRNGDPSNDPGDQWFERKVPWTSNWWKTQPGEAPGDENFYKGEGNVWKRRYGGDIQGLRQALPYLRSLGITAIYLNPIFEAESMHKYDTADYRHIDDNFGVREKLPLDGETDDPKTWKWSKSDRIFLDFLEEAHRQGFKVILDGVFNHVGRAHPFFQDVVKNGKKSKYVDWFEIEDFGNKTPADPEQFGQPGGMKFKAWDRDSGHLPVLKKDPKLGLAKGPRDHIMAITKRWLAPDGDPSNGIDGWRLDVPGDIPHPFWIDWHKVVRGAKPDAYISGEIWTWAQPWLSSGDQFDAVMNYRFAEPVQQFFVNQKTAIKPSEFNARLVELEMNYPLQVAMVQQNLFDSHDTDRAASMYVNPDRAYDAQNRPQDNAADVGYDPRKPNETEWARFRQATAFQMSFIGAPMIYYGNEAGMWGPDDPSNRQPMVWKELEPYDDPEVKFDQANFDFFQRAIAVRKALPALQTGFFRPVMMDDSRGLFAFARDLDGKSVIVVLNRNSSNQKIEIPIDAKGEVELIDWMNSDQVAVKRAGSGIDARPSASVKSDAKPLVAKDGKVAVELKPYGTMILSPK